MQIARNPSIEIIHSRLIQEVELNFSKTNILYRISSRIKSDSSIEEKKIRKGYSENHSMKDLFGVRITCYFYDDLEILKSIIEKIFDNQEAVYDQPDPTSFKAIRKNFVCSLPNDLKPYLTKLQENDSEFLIFDHTFELQLRSAFSDPWYEVDHSLRYKSLQYWEEFSIENRLFNGFLATTEVLDQGLVSLFQQLAYRSYKNGDHEAMIRFKFRVNFVPGKLSSDISSYLTDSKEFRKKIIRLRRDKVINRLVEHPINEPLTLDLFLHYVNANFLHDSSLKDLATDFDSAMY